MKARLTAVAVPFLISLANLTAAGAHAQSVYRCGSAYSQSPCAAGKVIDVTDSRTAEQKKLAEAASQRDGKTADAMEKARLKQEAQAMPAIILPTKVVPADKPAKPEKKASLKKKAGKVKPENFTATDGKKKEKKEKAKKPKPKAD